MPITPDMWTRALACTVDPHAPCKALHAALLWAPLMCTPLTARPLGWQLLAPLPLSSECQLTHGRLHTRALGVSPGHSRA